MISKNIEKVFNNQIGVEEQSARIYMAMASWCEVNGFPGASKYLYVHSDEERMHQTRLMTYINTRGGYAVLPKLDLPEAVYKSLTEVFEHILKHEEFVTSCINKMLDVTMKEKDYTSANFLQWYVNEQIEEEASAREVLDMIKLAGGDKGGMFHIDKDLAAKSVIRQAALIAAKQTGA